ncbi:class II fructose-bisphosphate aldolase [Actinokineospora sp. NBRC 105648]|uniref:class II fructose-bisphosphate aldolase n=1 Tax=Actinokineospora sp. NBRC 105648 TaxID=3032206 RepID=UPI0024A4BD7C|nr:class II fructose-bisphosphate aldolase [Actinokineospora sp. NBRC 105648]GLZ43786.1 fructose-bisphosphate aldolase [Actinokineospora sp. NBRC 105648]
MPLSPTAAVVAAAVRERRGVGAFNVIQLEHAYALVEGAERAGTAVILQISENCVRYHGSLEPIALATLAVARAATVPVAVHLDHVQSPDLVDEGIALGIGSVMFDASTLPYADNVDLTREITDRCHAAGVFVEAELGEIGGKDGVHAPGVRTDPAEAAAYVAATGVDALAVAVGSSHAMLTRDAVLDLELIARLADTVPVPLVLHGSSGVPDDQLTAAVRAGMTKVNIATHLNKTFTASVRGTLDAQPSLVDTRKYLGPARTATTTEVTRLLGVLNAVPATSIGVRA